MSHKCHKVKENVTTNFTNSMEMSQKRYTVKDNVTKMSQVKINVTPVSQQCHRVKSTPKCKLQKNFTRGVVLRKLVIDCLVGCH